MRPNFKIMSYITKKKNSPVKTQPISEPMASVGDSIGEEATAKTP